MRHRYETQGIVLARAPLGEATALVTCLTPGLGVVRARAQGLRQSGAKLASALTTYTESSMILVRGKEGWRVAGAVLDVQWIAKLQRTPARMVAARIAGLVVRLVPADEQASALFAIVRGLFLSLTTLPDAALESAEIVSALRILRELGFDAGPLPGALDDYSLEVLSVISGGRADYIARINRGIAASGL